MPKNEAFMPNFRHILRNIVQNWHKKSKNRWFSIDSRSVKIYGICCISWENSWFIAIYSQKQLFSAQFIMKFYQNHQYLMILRMNFMMEYKEFMAQFEGFRGIYGSFGLIWSQKHKKWALFSQFRALFPGFIEISKYFSSTLYHQIII